MRAFLEVLLGLPSFKKTKKDRAVCNRKKGLSSAKAEALSISMVSFGVAFPHGCWTWLWGIACFCKPLLLCWINKYVPRWMPTFTKIMSKDQSTRLKPPAC